jgi:hypothetical protein
MKKNSTARFWQTNHTRLQSLALLTLALSKICNSKERPRSITQQCEECSGKYVCALLTPTIFRTPVALRAFNADRNTLLPACLPCHNFMLLIFLSPYPPHWIGGGGGKFYFSFLYSYIPIKIETKFEAKFSVYNFHTKFNWISLYSLGY